MSKCAKIEFKISHLKYKVLISLFFFFQTVQLLSETFFTIMCHLQNI